MPDAPARQEGKAPAGGKKQFLGQPTWFWVAAGGILAAAAAYIWYKNRQNANAASQAAPASGYATYPFSSFSAYMLQHQASPKTKPSSGGGKGSWQWFTPTKSGTAGDLIADEKWSSSVGAEFLKLNNYTNSTPIPAGTKVKFPANATP